MIRFTNLLVTAVPLLLMLASVAATNSTGNSTENEVHLKPEQTIADYIATLNEELGLSNLTDGDIAPNDAFDPNNHRRQRRAAVRNHSLLWPGGVVPYAFHHSAYSTSPVIRQAISEFHARTCIRFVPRRSWHRNSIIFYGAWYSGCWSYVGRQRSTQQIISIGRGCENKAIVIHEILHALGFYHEQSRPDRDLYVQIHYQNIAFGRQNNFAKQSSSIVDSLGAFYDYDGIMHYGPNAFTRNGRPTITAVRPRYTRPGIISRVTFGQRIGFSQTDLIQLWALYRCKRNNTGSSIWSPWSSWAPCDLSCQSKRQRYCHRRDRSLCSSSNQHFIQIDSRLCSPYCIVDGAWTAWSSWSNCSSVCEDGIRSRTRSCSNPAPVNGGRPCQGPSREITPCWGGFCNPGPDDCDFESSRNPNCHWTNLNFLKFMLTSAGSTRLTGPPGDHSKNGAGRYLRFFGYPLSTRPAIARLRSKRFPSTPARTIKFFYNMFGRHVNYLRILIKDAYGEREIWRRVGSKSRRWLKAAVPFSSPHEFYIIFEAKNGRGTYDDMALDDIHFVEGGEIVQWSGWSAWSVCDVSCERHRKRVCMSYQNHKDCGDADLNGIQKQAEKCTSCSVNCDFDEYANPMCHWTSTSFAPFIRQRLSSPASRSGPSSDASKSGLGHYLLADSSRNTGNIQVKSRQFPPTRGTRLRFYYFMYGETVRDLTVYIHYGSVSKEIWKITGAQGRSWKMAEIIFYSPESYNIIFDALLNQFHSSDIAIDNISFEKVEDPELGWSVWSSWGPCSDNTCQESRERFCFDTVDAASQCPGNNKTEIQTRKCTTGRCTDDCTFDYFLYPYCHWTRSFPSRTGFLRAFGTTPTPGTGPERGYDPTNSTWNGGYYLYLESTYKTYGDVAVLQSKLFNATNAPRQMIFYYNMYGRSINQLRVLMQVNSTRTQLWQLHGNQGSQWIEGSVNFTSEHPYRILIEAAAGDTYESDIAIDQITFNDPIETTNVWSDWTDWSKCDAFCIQRRQRSCIAKDLSMCNSAEIETEERGCNHEKCSGDCDFENDEHPFCNWEVLPEGIPFQRKQGNQTYIETDVDESEGHGYRRWHRSRPGHGSRRGQGHGRWHRLQPTPSGPPSHSGSDDHSYGRRTNETNHYIMMDSSYSLYGKWAHLQSKLFSPTDHAVLSFDYLMHGASVNSLKVFLIINGFKNLLFAKTGDQGDGWYSDFVTIDSQYPYRILFEATAGIDYRADIGLDNIALEFGDVDGHWSEWSSWSNCSASCTQIRKRTCTEPRRQGAGADCYGRNKETQNCTGGQCFSGCGGVFMAENGTIITPNYPEHYLNNIECVWRITVPTGQVGFSFSDFELESHPQCIYDSVQIRSGSWTTKLCGINGQGYVLNSNSSTVTITLRTDGSVTRKGFKMSWANKIFTTMPPTTTVPTTRLPITTKIPNICGGSFSGISGAFASPNYPRNYGNNHNCIWTITVPDGYRVRLTFTAFNLERGYDYVNIRDGGSSGSLVARLTSTDGQGKTYFTIAHSKMFVRFTTDSSVTRSGFSATWIAFRGILPSPTPSSRPVGNSSTIIASSAFI